MKVFSSAVLAAALLFAGCTTGGGGQADGTVTVTLGLFPAGNGHTVYFGIYPSGAHPGADPPLGRGSFAIASGGGAAAAQSSSGTRAWTGSGGTTYDLYLIVDMNDNIVTVAAPEPGIDYQAASWPIRVTIDGDQSVSCTGVDLIVVPVPPDDGTVTVELTSFPEGDGHTAFVSIFASGANPAVDLILAEGCLLIMSGDGSVVVHIAGDINTVWTGTGGTSYDLYFWVNMDDDFAITPYPESGVDYRASNWPVSITISGNQTLGIAGADLSLTPDLLGVVDAPRILPDQTISGVDWNFS